jgi:4-carboxymuconolactone decarboxylase
MNLFHESMRIVPLNHLGRSEYIVSTHNPGHCPNERTEMKLLATMVMSLSMVASAVAQDSQTITITRSGSQPSRQGSAQYFTGSARIDPLFETKDSSNTSGAYVTFEPGARSAWHTHPIGQTLIVTAGTGLVQRWGAPVEEIRPGDVIWIPPGQKHWHGASPASTMTHIAIQGAVDGRNVDWMEKVSEEQYKMTGTPASAALSSTPALDDVRMVAPALERYSKGALGDLWSRPGLSARDRSLVTVTVLIARNQTTELSTHLNRALDNGVTASEISEVITHLAFYSGWANAMSAIAPARDVFRVRGIGTDQLPPAGGPLLPIDEASEARRAAFVEQNVGPVAPGVVQYTSDPLFHDLWLRPALAPRDRSLVTVSALIASGQVAQLSAHLNRAMDNGLTKSEASEALTHLLFYAGWPNVFSAVPVAKDVFEKRPQ